MRKIPRSGRRGFFLRARRAKKIALLLRRDDLRGALDDVIGAPQTSESLVSAREQAFLRADEFHAADRKSVV